MAKITATLLPSPLLLVGADDGAGGVAVGIGSGVGAAIGEGAAVGAGSCGADGAGSGGADGADVAAADGAGTGAEDGEAVPPPSPVTVGASADTDGCAVGLASLVAAA